MENHFVLQEGAARGIRDLTGVTAAWKEGRHLIASKDPEVVHPPTRSPASISSSMAGTSVEVIPKATPGAVPEVVTPRSGSGRLTYRPQLDSLRALAVSAVLVHHFLDNGWGTGAILGVKLFFVLSGFLITTILLRGRAIAERAVPAGASRMWREAGRFYLRRVLRIFPLYYFVVAVCVVIDLEPTRDIVVWLASYTLNIRFALQGYYDANFAHFWTLAVEEQFYMFWPWFVLFGARRWLPAITCALVALGPLYRWLSYSSDLPGLATYAMTPAYADTLGMGALLAVLSNTDGSREWLARYLTRAILPVSAVAFVALYVLESQGLDGGVGLLLGDVALSGVFCWMIASAARGFTGAAGAVLEWKPLRYLGRISYGIYVYHPFMPALCLWVLARAGWGAPTSTAWAFLLFSVATLLVSSLSWHVLEKPLTSLGREQPARGSSSQTFDRVS
jgi:peptidoglycan/LPS O-acetylase OafA/YrhL